MTAKSTTAPTPTRTATAAGDSKRVDPLVLGTYLVRFPRDLEARAKDWRGGERAVVGGSGEDPALDPGEAG